jgi:toxin ParE1/3/4
MKQIYFTPKARRDAKLSASWLRKQNPLAADRFLDAVENTAAKLGRMPMLGSRNYADTVLQKGVRMIAVEHFKNYLLFFVERDASIDIVRILHGARDISYIMESEEQ